MSLLEVSDLGVNFRSGGREIVAAEGVSFTLDRGETLALVGESGSGKSVTALSVLQLLPYPAAFHPKGSILLDGQQMVGAEEARLREIRGAKVGMVFQEPMTSLNPLHTVEKQISEAITLHRPLAGAPLRARVVELLHGASGRQKVLELRFDDAAALAAAQARVACWMAGGADA